MLFDTQTSLGKFIVLLLVQIFSAVLVNVHWDRKKMLMLLYTCLGVTLICFYSSGMSFLLL